MSKTRAFPNLVFLSLILLGLACSARGEEILNKNGAEVLGWQLSDSQFRTCSGNPIAIEGGSVQSTSERCSRDDRLLENYRRGIEGRGLLIIEPDPTGIISIETPMSIAAPDNVPMLGVPRYKMKSEKKVGVNLFGNLSRARAKVSVKPVSGVTKRIRTEVKELNNATLPSGANLVLWAVSPEGKIMRLGQLVNASGKKAEIKAETAMQDFGLFMTVETVREPSQPRGAVVLKVNK